MAHYARSAPELAMQAIGKLDFDPAEVTHIVVASCTGFVAPGIDQILARRLGLSASVERLLIGFMGCYAGVTALRAARHIVRSQPDAVVLMVSVELSTLHLEDSTAIEPLLAMLQFSDGAAAAIIDGQSGPGVGLGEGISLALPESDELIRWDIGEQGFVMRLSGEVPARIEAALHDAATQAALFGDFPPTHLAIHAGGRSILDAVERAMDLPSQALSASRAVLADCATCRPQPSCSLLNGYGAVGPTGRVLRLPLARDLLLRPYIWTLSLESLHPAQRANAARRGNGCHRPR
jgi:predicted naringenin-chalcone synthase